MGGFFDRVVRFPFWFCSARRTLTIEKLEPKQSIVDLVSQTQSTDTNQIRYCRGGCVVMRSVWTSSVPDVAMRFFGRRRKSKSNVQSPVIVRKHVRRPLSSSN